MSLLNDLVMDNVKRIKGKPIDKVPASVHEQRVRICDRCPHVKEGEFGKYCGICGCYANSKAEYADESCPDTPKRWLKYSG